VPIPFPKWVLAYYLAPIFCGANHHKILDWHVGTVQSSAAHPASVVVFLLQFFENNEKPYSTSVITNILIWETKQI
jgi:hypothetical protein